MKKPLKQKITDYINSLSEELRSSIEYKKKKPKTPKLRKVASLVLVFSLVIYLLIGCFGSIKSSAAESYQLSGTYVFDTDIGLRSFVSISEIVAPVSFSCNGIQYNSITARYQTDEKYRDNYYLLYGDSEVYAEGQGILNDGWYDEIYRTITFDGVQTVDQAFYVWFTSVTGSSGNSFIVSQGLYFLRYPLNTLRGTISFSTPFVSHSNFYTSIEFVGIESNELLSINYVDNADNITNVYYGDNIGWRDDEYSVILIQEDVNVTQEEYDLFNGAFVSLAENDTLNTLYNAGLENGQAFGFSQGYDSGYAVGYADGFTAGAADGMADGFMGNFFGGIVEALDALKLFGELSVLNIIEAVLGLMLVVWILKLIAGG